MYYKAARLYKLVLFKIASKLMWKDAKVLCSRLVINYRVLWRKRFVNVSARIGKYVHMNRITTSMCLILP